MTCNNKCIHHPVCEQKNFEFANIEECPYYCDNTINTNIPNEWKDFAEFVAKEVCTDDFKENADSFAELACRKLEKFGLVEKTESEWIWRRKING